jgi:hypothetical protein
VEQWRELEDFIARLASLELGPASDAVAARELASFDPVEAATVLKFLIARAAGSTAASRALATTSRALVLASDRDLSALQREDIRAAAVELGLAEVAALFVSGPPAKVIDPGAIEKPDPTLAHLSLGHKKMLARTLDANGMARLCAEADPRVLRELLQNPRLTEELVLRVVARRPVRADVVWEVFRSTRWGHRLSVRRGIAANPSSPPELALKILPHLRVGDLRPIASDASLHEAVRALAATLIKARTPRG